MNFPYFTDVPFDVRGVVGQVHITHERRADRDDVLVYEDPVIGSRRGREGDGTVVPMDWGARTRLWSGFCADVFFSPQAGRDVGSDLSNPGRNAAVFTMWRHAGTAGAAREYMGFMLLKGVGPGRGPELVYLCIGKSFRGRRLGAVMLKMYENVAKRHAIAGNAPNGLVVFVAVLNTRGTRRFYAREGYDYVDPDDAAVAPVSDDVVKEIQGKTFAGDATNHLTFTVTMFKRLESGFVTVPSPQQLIPSPSILARTAMTATREAWLQDVVKRLQQISTKN